MFTWSAIFIAYSISCHHSVSSRSNGDINIKETSVSYVPQRCLLDSAPGTCRNFRWNYFFNIKTGQCERFAYGGCGGNWNRFTSLSRCHRTCTCATPKETGPCRGHFRRWFFSPADGWCRPFVYGGCGGNSNNYETWLDCSNRCGFPSAGSDWWKSSSGWGKSDQSGSFNISSTSWKKNNQSSLFNNTRAFHNKYSKEDFIRDWQLWGLLMGGEGGDLDIDELSTLIDQAHMLGIGRTSQFGYQGSSSAAANASSSGGFYDEESVSVRSNRRQGRSKWGLGDAKGGMANWGPTYKTGKPGSFTPLGEVGSIKNLIDTDSRTRGLGGSSQFTDKMQSWGKGFVNANQVRENHRNKARSQFGGQSGLGQGSWISRGGRGDTRLGRRNLQRAWSEGNWASGNGRKSGASTNDNVNLNAKVTGRFQHNTRSGTFNMRMPAMEIFHLIAQVGSGSLHPADIKRLGNRFYAIDSNGNVNIDVLARRLIGSLQGPSAMNIADLKGVARSLGALDRNGNIDKHMFINGLTRSLSGVVSDGDWTGGVARGASSGRARDGGSRGGSRRNVSGRSKKGSYGRK